MVLLQPGTQEPLKAASHGAMGILAVVFALYNGAAWWGRREPHLAVNALIYGAIAVLETQHIRHHLQAVGPHVHTSTR